MRESPPICRGHVHTGRSHHTSVIEDNSVFKKFSVMSFQGKKKQTNLKLEKNKYLSKSKNTQLLREFLKKSAFLKTD